MVGEVSPPFEGGVAGTTSFVVITKFNTRTGWLIYFLPVQQRLDNFQRFYVIVLVRVAKSQVFGDG